MSLALSDVRKAVEEWMHSEAVNTAADVVPLQGDIGTFKCRYHENLAKGVSGVTIAEVIIRVYVSRAHEETAHDVIDDIQSRFQESLESFSPRPWLQINVMSSDVAEEVRGEATYEVVRFTTQFWV
jgi:uncharacterized alkaline shock family protein YloU